MDAGVGFYNGATVSVIRAITIWDYIIFFGTIVIIGLIGFFSAKFIYSKLHKKSGFLGTEIDRL